MAKDNPDFRQASFAAGEWSPLMYARSDYKKFPMALRKCLNWIVTQQGALINRSGTQFLAPCKFNDRAVRLVPFNFSNDQNFVMEFGEFYIRFYQNATSVIGGGGFPVEVVTPYFAADLAKLKFTQSGDVITITHQNYAPQDLKRLNTAGTSWSFGATPLSARAQLSTLPRLEFVWLTTPLTADATGKRWQWGVTAVYADGTETIVTMTSEVTTPINPAVTPVVINWIPPNIVTQKQPIGYNIYKGRSRTLGFTAFVPGGQTQTYTDGGDAPDFSQEPPKHTTPFAGIPFTWAAQTTYWPGDRVFVNGNTYEALNYGVTGLAPPAVTDGVYVDGGPEWVPGQGHVAGFLCTMNDHQMVATVGGISGTPTPSYPGQSTNAKVDGTQTWNLAGPTSYNGPAVTWKFVQVGLAVAENPAVGAYFDQRQVFANTKTNPTRVVGSQTGNFKSFDVQDTPLASDAIDFSLASQRYEEIRSFLQLRVLLALTSEKDWAISGSNGAAIAPASIEARPNNVRGSSWLDPIVSGNVALYVQALGSQIWELNFDFYTQSYLGTDVTIEASHLFQRHQIVSWAFAPVPFSVVWAVREDGVLLGMTHVREQEVRAWHRHTTPNGAFESVCCVPETVDGVSETGVYVSVRRIINGSTVRYVERFSTRQLPIAGYVDDYPVIDVTKGVFLDCSIVTTGWVIPILGHLEGQQVMVLADGNVAGPFTVTGGRIDLTSTFPDGPPTTVLVGLAYNSDVESLDLIPPNMEIRSNMKNVYRASFEVADTRGMAVGPDLASLKSWDQRQVTDGFNAVAPFTGLEHLRIVSKYDHGGRLVFRHSDPLPAVLLAFGRETNVGGD